VNNPTPFDYCIFGWARNIASKGNFDDRAAGKVWRELYPVGEDRAECEERDGANGCEAEGGVFYKKHGFLFRN
jgi:hypothetical protein